MQFLRRLFAFALAVILLSPVVMARINIVIVRNVNDAASSDFRLKFIPSPSPGDVATKANISIIDGSRDNNGGDLVKLSDDHVPTGSDQPAENFFFAAGASGGRLLFDLGSPLAIEQVNTYSWHTGSRGPQVYELYASDGTSAQFDRAPKRGSDPEKSGWTHVASVDTRPSEGEPGGQYGVSIFDSDSSIGNFRYLLFDISRTEDADAFGNTFYSEIDVIASNARPAKPSPHVVTVQMKDGYQMTIDTSGTPDLTGWAQQELAPVATEWYPKIVKMLSSEDYEAPRSFRITFSPSMQGVAATGGTQIHCAADWFRRNLKGEAKGAVVHELVHVVQQYGRVGPGNRDGRRPPGWLVEGIADHIRWNLYEPESGGAKISPQNRSRVRYDDSYRVIANFLNWVTEQYDQDIVAKLNAALREGRYSEELWSERTGRTVEELADEWKSGLERQPAAEAEGKSNGISNASQVAVEPAINTLSDEEKAEGWRLLFNGVDFDGWHCFGIDSVGTGWRIVDGALVCNDPRHAGDLCTTERYEWFELRLQYNIAAGGNSGIMYRVTDDGRSAWETGPEFQLQDNARGRDPILSGWLYGLYQPPDDQESGKPLDATKPAGEWNEVRLLVSRQKCEHEINGVKYFEYVLESEDFQSRVARSKFGRMPLFAKAPSGFLALQGDHGQISFRNIKIRRIE